MKRYDFSGEPDFSVRLPWLLQKKKKTESNTFISFMNFSPLFLLVFRFCNLFYFSNYMYEYA